MELAALFVWVLFLALTSIPPPRPTGCKPVFNPTPSAGRSQRTGRAAVSGLRRVGQHRPAGGEAAESPLSLRVIILIRGNRSRAGGSEPLRGAGRRRECNSIILETSPHSFLSLAQRRGNSRRSRRSGTERLGRRARLVSGRGGRIWRLGWPPLPWQPIAASASPSEPSRTFTHIERGAPLSGPEQP